MNVTISIGRFEIRGRNDWACGTKLVANHQRQRRNLQLEIWTTITGHAPVKLPIELRCRINWSHACLTEKHSGSTFSLFFSPFIKNYYIISLQNRNNQKSGMKGKGKRQIEVHRVAVAFFRFCWKRLFEVTQLKVRFYVRHAIHSVDGGLQSRLYDRATLNNFFSLANLYWNANLQSTYCRVSLSLPVHEFDAIESECQSVCYNSY